MFSRHSATAPSIVWCLPARLLLQSTEITQNFIVGVANMRVLVRASAVTSPKGPCSALRRPGSHPHLAQRARGTYAEPPS
jgi:hypothetical protein